MTKFGSCQGQALAELTILLPIVFLVLAAPGSLTQMMTGRFASDAGRIDDDLKKFQNLEVDRMRSLRAASCAQSLGLSPARGHTAAVSTEWPTEVDRQRALSMAALRAGCLAEATAKLGPAAALPLWTVHLAAPNEAIARASAQTLCPQIKAASERVRLSIINAQRFIRPPLLAQAFRLAQESSEICPMRAISGSRLDRLFAPILDP